MDRALELIEFLGRRARTTSPTWTGAPNLPRFDEPAEDFTPDTMLTLQRTMANPDGSNPFGNVSHMPPEHRAMIDWAEEQMRKGKGN